MKKLLTLALVLLVATTAFAQNKGRIMGTVTTGDGAVITGVKVTIASDALISRSVSVSTNERGQFRFVLLPVGSFSIKFEKEGYKTVEQSGIELGFDATATINRTLESAEFSEVITISGEAPVVDKTSSTIGDKLDLEFLQNQPNTRDIWDLPNLTAGYNDDSGLGGVQDAGNTYNIDGINVSDPSTKTLAVDVNFEAVEQIDVSLFGANAEYGSFTGAALNVVTKSGGNEFSGEANYFAQRKDWVSDNTTEYERISTPAAADINTFGLALGGPIMEDKVWFFANFNYLKDETERGTLDGPLSVTNDPQRWYGKISGRWDDRNITYASYMRYDRELSHRVYWPGSTAWNVNRESSLWQQMSESDTFLGQHSFVMSDDVIFEGRYAGYRTLFTLEPRGGTEAPMLYDFVNGVHLPGSNANRSDVNDRDRDNFLATVNYYNDEFYGNHSFKAGLEYESSLSSREFSIEAIHYYAGNTPAYWFDFGHYTAPVRTQRMAGFAQDSWNVNDKLTLNLGFRIDSTSLKADDPDIAPIGDETIFTFNDPAYRLGFAYDLTGDGKTVIRGFVGRYYEGVVSGDTEAFVVTKPTEDTYAWTGSSWVLIDSSGGSGNTTIDDDYSNQYSEGLTVGVERELLENVSGGVTFIYKRDRNIIGQISPDFDADYIANYSYSNANGSYSGPVWLNYVNGLRAVLTNPKPGDPGVDGELFRNYYGLAFDVNKRFSDNWSLRASYTYSRNTGTAGQAFSAIQGFGNFSDPNYWINADGRAQLERPHVFKASGTYIAPFDIYISPAFSWQSGYAYAITHVAAGDTDAVINIKPVDGNDRYDAQMNLDLRLEKAFVIADRYRVGVLFDIFNVFNDDAVTAFFSRNIESSNFQVPSTVVAPRIYQIGARIIF